MTNDFTLPTGAIEGKPENFKLSEAQQRALSLIPLQNKTPPEPENKKAIILWGPPGSGKTTQGHKLLRERGQEDSFVSICYDENGALNNIPGYKEALSRAADNESRLTLYKEHRDDSQRIRSYTFEKAIQKGHNLFIDVTGAGVGAQKMIDMLKAQGYRDIEVVGYLASAEVAESRINGRSTKVVEHDDIISKRIGCYESLPGLMAKADEFTLYLNNKGQSPKKIIETKTNGQIAFVSGRAKRALNAVFNRDEKHFASHHDEQETAKLKAAIHSTEASLDKLPDKTWKERISQKVCGAIRR